MAEQFEEILILCIETDKLQWLGQIQGFEDIKKYKESFVKKPVGKGPRGVSKMTERHEGRLGGQRPAWLVREGSKFLSS